MFLLFQQNSEKKNKPVFITESFHALLQNNMTTQTTVVCLMNFLHTIMSVGIKK